MGIQIGEAKARRVANRARVNLSKTKKALLIEISERVEATADKLFKTIQGNHKTIADNYLSFKAYAVTASSKITQYVIKGKGKNLSSLGDLLVNVAAMSSVTAKKAEGIGAGSNTLPAVFTVKNVKVSNHAGNWVFINGRAVGLSNKLNDFESLAVRMG